jgi:hypothetical protein
MVMMVMMAMERAKLHGLRIRRRRRSVKGSANFWVYTEVTNHSSGEVNDQY